MHCQATGLKPEQDFDLTRKVEFLKRIRKAQIANKIIKSAKFKDYTRYSLQACFARALELEGDFMVGEVVDPNYTQTQILPVEGEDTTDAKLKKAQQQLGGQNPAPVKGGQPAPPTPPAKTQPPTPPLPAQPKKAQVRSPRRSPDPKAAGGKKPGRTTTRK